MPRPRVPWSVLRVGLRALAAGATQPEAAAFAGVGVVTLRAAALEHGVGVLRERHGRPDALTIDEREEVFAGIARGESDLTIARRLGRHRSTIWREIKAGGGRGRYRPHRAQQRSDDVARRCRPCWTETRPWLWAEVIDLMRAKKWSPEQISSWLRREHPERVSRILCEVVSSGCRGCGRGTRRRTR